MFNKALNNMRFIYFYCTNAIREIYENSLKNSVNSTFIMNKSSFFVVGKHAVIEPYQYISLIFACDRKANF